MKSGACQCKCFTPAQHSSFLLLQSMGVPLGPDGQVAPEADASKEATLAEMREVRTYL